VRHLLLLFLCKERQARKPAAVDHFLPGRWVSAEPAAVFAALLAFGSRRTFDAAEAALLLVTSDFAKPFTSFPGFLTTESCL
jgi:hypothetical protein